MAALGHAAPAIATPALPVRISTASRRVLNLRMRLCSRKDENAGDLFHSRSSEDNGSRYRNMDAVKESSSSEKGGDIDNSDIWKLFNNAQRNILYLNKQRLQAVEELDQIQREKQLLLSRLKQLEMEKETDMLKGDSIQEKGGVAKSTKSAIFWELLLRVDSMVLSSLVNKEEASDLRKVIVDNRVSLDDAFPDIRKKMDLELLLELRHFSNTKKRKGLHIVHISCEMEPLASVGPLAPYVTGLSSALQRKGDLVEVILPKYGKSDLGAVQGLRRSEVEFDSFFAGHWHKNRVWAGFVYGIGVTLVEPVHYSSFFNRDSIYGYSDDFERFTYFSRASLDYLIKVGKQPDILHIHNWQTAIVGPLFWDIFVHQGLHGTRILFTCHDLSTQCLEKPEKLELCGLNPLRLHQPDRLQDAYKAHLVNMLKGGIVYSNSVVLMSSLFSKERLIHSLSYGLESTLTSHKEKVLIAPYGFDGSVWDPSLDKYLPTKYSADDIKGKGVCRVALTHHLGFSGRSCAIVGCICPNVSDFDTTMLKLAISLCLTRGVQFVLLGPHLPAADLPLQALQDELREENVRFINKYEEALLHLVLAGSDIMLCFTFHDPVLQVPLKALKYGAAPIAIDVGIEGLRKTEWYEVGKSSGDDSFRPSEMKDLGSATSSQHILSAFGNLSLSQALDEIENDPSRWNWRIRDGMSKDFSWDAECCDVHLAAYTFIKNL